MKKLVNLNIWSRASAFQHFITYSNPYFGICTEVDCSEAYQVAKSNDLSFFIYYFYLSLKTANEIPEFRMRIENKVPVIYDKVQGSPTILKHDGELGYAMIEYHDDFETFYKAAKLEIDAVKQQTKLDTSKDRPDTVYYSIIPWINFTSVEHPMDIPSTEGIPILTFGEMNEKNGRLFMPLAIHAHHALMDGLHMATFVKEFQNKLSQSVL